MVRVPSTAPLPSWGHLARWMSGLGCPATAAELYYRLYRLMIAVASLIPRSQEGRFSANWPFRVEAQLPAVGAEHPLAPYREPGEVLVWPEELRFLLSASRRMDEEVGSVEPFPDDRVPHRRWTVDRGWGLLWQPSGARSYRREVRLLGPLGSTSGRGASDHAPPRAALSPLIGTKLPTFHFGVAHAGARDTHLFHATRTIEPEGLANRVCELLDTLGELDLPPNLVVLPELKVDSAGWKSIETWVQRVIPPPDLIAAGSFHVPHGDSFCNQMPLIGSSGTVLAKVHKSGLFRTSGKHLPSSVLSLGVKNEAICLENIVYGREFVVAETSWGRTAFAICADVLDLGTPWADGLREVEPDLLVISSMTGNTSTFEELAQRIRRLRVTSVFINAAPICSSHKVVLGAGPCVAPKAPAVALLTLPWKDREGCPTQWGWWYGDETPRYWTKQGWTLPNSNICVPMTLLSNEHGVLIDLAGFAS